MRQVSELRPDVHLTEATSRGKTLRSVFKEIKAIPGALAQDVRARRRKSESQAKQGAPGKTEGAGGSLRHRQGHSQDAKCRPQRRHLLCPRGWHEAPVTLCPTIK